ncbi:MAG: hypothetical protein K1X89_06820, partial [Myxococcaceae bacterium]|nr:hypothetical protein [Myxococcaceae bacterium]
MIRAPLWLIAVAACLVSGCRCAQLPGNARFPCDVDGRCAASELCVQGVCEACLPIPDGGCQLATCSDRVLSGNETDIDCGGGACGPCGGGQPCQAFSDCLSGACSAGVCDGPGVTCGDHLRNANETDVDCGGACPACADGLQCRRESDCGSGVCAEHACAVPACSDHVRNGKETDVDCGGGCSACQPGQACAAATDCSSHECSAGRCVLTSADDVARWSSSDEALLARGSSAADRVEGTGALTVTGLGFSYGDGRDGECVVRQDLVLTAETCVGRNDPDGRVFGLEPGVYAAGTSTLRLDGSPLSIIRPGDKVLVVAVQLLKRDGGLVELDAGDLVGQSELAEVAEIGPRQLVLARPLAGTYDAERLQVIAQRVPQYASVVVEADAGLTTEPWDCAAGHGGVLAFLSRGPVTVRGRIDASGRGFSGGNAGTDSPGAGEGQAGQCRYRGATAFPRTQGGGAGAADTAASAGSAGGGGAHLSAGSQGASGGSKAGGAG